MKKINNLIILSTVLITGVVAYKLVKKNKEDKIIMNKGKKEYNDVDIENDENNIEENTERHYILLNY